MVGNIFGGIIGKVVENAEGILDKVITTDKERDAAKLAIKKLMLEAEKEAFAKEVEASVNRTLSCGLLGPEILVTTVLTSNDKVSVNTTSLLVQKPCSFEYFSTNSIVSLSLPDNFKYFKDSSSTGKKPHVAPYSGAILAIVALSAKVKFFKPSP